MKTRYYTVITGLIIAFALNAQDQTQAFRYSQFYPVGTARYASMGGAFGAIGADFTAASQNPAGLGLFRNSEFTFTPSYIINNTTSDYLGQKSTDIAANMSIANLGLVTTIERDSWKNGGLMNVTLGFGYNALNNFHSTTLMQGVNNNSSLLDNFTWNANNNTELDIFYEDLAHELALMPLDTIDDKYWHYLEPYDAIDFDGYGQEQTRIIEKRGYTGEYVFSGALNLDHKLYIGGTMGIHVVRFYEDIYHEEFDFNDLEPDFDAFSFVEYNSTRGYGYVFKLGLIYKPIHMLRLGAAFHRPVVYNLTDDKFTDLNTYWNSNAGISDGYVSSGMFSKKYTLRTPFRASASAALLLGKIGLLSAEYEYVDYSMSDLNSPGYRFSAENITISRDFTAAHNVKSGFELRFNPVYVRGGFQYYMNPFADKRNGSDIFVYSGGLGFRFNQTFVDLSYSMMTKSELYGLYHYAPEFEDGFEKSYNSYRRSNIMVTLGYNL
ncbi:MAG: outer membrane protein transport protein [Bacteroidales bacterium]|nr:outer membrane protein transport protein [Bacteroidales bacterium]